MKREGGDKLTLKNILKARQELVRLNNAKASSSLQSTLPEIQHHFADPHQTISECRMQDNSHTNKPFFRQPSRQHHPALLQLNISSAEESTTASDTDFHRFTQPTKQPQQRQIPFSSDSSNQSISTSYFKSNSGKNVTVQNPVASSSSISSFSSYDFREKSADQASRISLPPAITQIISSESDLPNDLRKESISRKPKNARVVLKKNRWSSQSHLCFQPVTSPSEDKLHRPKVLNQINRPSRPPTISVPPIRPMPSHVHIPLQQNNMLMHVPLTPRPPRMRHDTIYMNETMMNHSSQMQYYNPTSAQQNTYFHGQFVPNFIVEQELRARASKPSTPPDVKPSFYERSSISNRLERENEVEHVDRRQALYPDVYEKNDGE